MVFTLNICVFKNGKAEMTEIRKRRRYVWMNFQVHLSSVQSKRKRKFSLMFAVFVLWSLLIVLWSFFAFAFAQCGQIFTVRKSRSDFCPPANGGWGKVMFLHLCVILFTGEGVSLSVQGRGVCCQGDLLTRTVKRGRYTSYWNAFLF